MEMAEAMETFWTDSAQWWDNHESKATFAGFAAYNVNLNVIVIIHLLWLSVHFLTYKNDPRNQAIKNQKLGAGNNPCPIQPFKNYILTYPTFDTNIYDFVITIQKKIVSLLVNKDALIWYSDATCFQLQGVKLMVADK